MLIRMFRGFASAGSVESYASYLRDRAAPHILAHPGVRELHIYEPMSRSKEFLVESRWDDVSSLIAFAGTEWYLPKILGPERTMITKAEVSHYRPGRRFSGSVVTAASGRVAVEPAAGIANIDGTIYELPPLESRLFAELVRRSGVFVEPGELARAVWRATTTVAPNDVRRAVYRLRKAIEDDNRTRPVILNRRGYGYKLQV